ncbi:MAG: hypothetical protein H5U06_05590 [Candidatus Aminicenantes bacterium]|nr:hypothetical protein [Candidatus Aminicenantes bacterium]
MAVGDLIWVITSTAEPGKGVLVDVFNGEGKYVDCFYLKFPFEVKAGNLELSFSLVVSEDRKEISVAVRKMVTPYTFPNFRHNKKGLYV